MKKTILIITICFICKLMFAQNSINHRDDLIKDKAIFLCNESGKLKYFEIGKYAEREPLQSNHTFGLKRNFTNIYIGWMNPLKYNITWKDTFYADDRDKVVNDFIKLYVSPFGSTITDLNSTEVKSMLANLPQPIIKKGNEAKTRLYGIKAADNFDGFNNLSLMEFYLHLRNNEGKLTNKEIIQLNSILKELEFLDNLNHSKLSDEVDEQFVELFSIERSDDVIAKLKIATDKLGDWDAIFKNIDKSKTKISTLLGELNVESDAFIQLYTKTVISNFASLVDDNLNANKKRIGKFIPCVDIIENSIKGELNTEKGYFLNRDIGFDDGKIAETEITITEFEYKKDTKEFTKKSVSYTSKIKFQKYDWVVPVVSAGVFYSDATLKGFGVSTDSSGAMKVSEDNINRNTAVTGLFLNLIFDIGSRFIAPAIQLGTDPTKKRPYMLLGGGLSFPVAKLALTGGWIWTWDAYLDGLYVGQSIKSTTDLDKATKYKFNLKTKGWYLGIQYNF
ncbi:MAG: hypothetical protein IPQ02_15080 [Saprospiraceae bacterium]|nr:hypothetical protein [Candidatus Defluviibacterium haderslevense]